MKSSEKLRCKSVYYTDYQIADNKDYKRSDEYRPKSYAVIPNLPSIHMNTSCSKGSCSMKILKVKVPT
ncbi:MAG: hypothetical protein IJZ94_04120 [Clostridia bacterium]|nr:hypothetical protein [Clostridia bacterium]